MSESTILITSIRLLFILSCLNIGLYSVVSYAEENTHTIDSDIKLFAQAVEYSQNKNWSKAEPIYRQLIARNKQWPEPGNNLAILLLQTGRISEAQKVFEQALNSIPGYKTTLHNRTQLYQYLASQAYDKALGLHKPKNIPALEIIQTIYQVKPEQIILVQKKSGLEMSGPEKSDQEMSEQSKTTQQTIPEKMAEDKKIYEDEYIDDKHIDDIHLDDIPIKDSPVEEGVTEDEHLSAEVFDDG